MSQQMNWTNDATPGPSHARAGHTGLSEFVSKKPPKSIILEPPPPSPEQGTSTASRSTNTRVHRKKANRVEISDEELARGVASSIKGIIQRSLTENFRQECFQLMKVTNSDDAEVFIRNKLRTTIKLPAEIHETTMEQRMQASQAAGAAARRRRNSKSIHTLSSSTASMLSRSELQSVLPNTLEPHNSLICPNSSQSHDSQLAVPMALPLQSFLRRDSNSLQNTPESQSQQSPIVTQPGNSLIPPNSSHSEPNIPMALPSQSFLQRHSFSPNSLLNTTNSQSHQSPVAVPHQSQNHNSQFVRGGTQELLSETESRSRSPSPSLLRPETPLDIDTQGSVGHGQPNSVQSDDVSSSQEGMPNAEEIRISGNVHLNENGLPVASSSSQQNSQTDGKKNLLLKHLGALMKAEKKGKKAKQ